MATFKLTEVKFNLFSAPSSFSLAHAVASELNSAKGTLAWQFSVIFGQVDDLRKQHIESGNIAALEIDSRFIYFLVTKKRLYERSTYDTVHAALICMREHMRNHNVHKVAMPRICCGNDKLEWRRIKDIIYNVFANEYNVEILVCNPPVMTAHVFTLRKCEIIETEGNLFQAPESFSLAHSVSADFAMCNGTGLQFKVKFRRVPELLAQHKQSGSVAMLRDKGRFIYYLVTKERNHERCTYPALHSSLVALRDHMVKYGVTKLAMPRIGCGIDSLDWQRVKTILEYVFNDVSVEIMVYQYNSPAKVSLNDITQAAPGYQRWL